MGRKKGPDPAKLSKLRNTLNKHSNGIWIRELSRQSGISKSTTHRYITKYMHEEVNELLSISGLVRVYKLE